MRKPKPLSLCCAVLCAGYVSSASADFFSRLKDVVEDTAKRTTEAIIVQKTQEIIRDMIIGYTSVQTKTPEEVNRDYEKETGSRPVNTTVSAYRTQILPGDAVSPGTKVRVKSYIEVVEGSSGKPVVLEERLTIWDNEDNTIALKAMTKEAGERGGGFTGEFSFTLPEGLPQGVYPVSSDLMLNGELVGDKRHSLQLVWLGDSGHLLVAAAPARY
ncbi:hypothetical protein [Parahaliea mediterranea]|uniref:hypothetical protein n=1 Tax=Parahaliea mediterranea TaxID=651086 RepID=UPI000E2F1740|nr:hypothetical protein [Parahaliea mediterranea]